MYWSFLTLRKLSRAQQRLPQDSPFELRVFPVSFWCRQYLSLPLMIHRIKNFPRCSRTSMTGFVECSLLGNLQKSNSSLCRRSIDRGSDFKAKQTFVEECRMLNFEGARSHLNAKPALLDFSMTSTSVGNVPKVRRRKWRRWRKERSVGTPIHFQYEMRERIDLFLQLLKWIRKVCSGLVRSLEMGQ